MEDDAYSQSSGPIWFPRNNTAVWKFAWRNRRETDAEWIAGLRQKEVSKQAAARANLQLCV